MFAGSNPLSLPESRDGPVSSTTTHSKHRKLWLCPHVGIDFDQAKELCSKFTHTESAVQNHRPRLCQNENCDKDILQSRSTSVTNDGKVTYKLTTAIWLLMSRRIPPPSETYDRIFTLERVAVALHGLDIPICPHIRLNHLLILSAFDPRC